MNETLVVCAGNTVRRFVGRKQTHKAVTDGALTAAEVEQFRVNPEGLEDTTVVPAEMEAAGKKLFEHTRNTMGFTGPQWEEIAPETKQNYYNMITTNLAHQTKEQH